MNRREFSFATLAFLPAMSALGATLRGSVAGAAGVHPAVTDLYRPQPQAMRTLEGWLGERIAVNLEKRLLAGVDLDVLLAGFRNRPGQHTWIGEHCAKFIDAATYTWALTGNTQLKDKLDRAVRELIACQEPDGYLGTYLPADRWKNWDVWAHKYNLIALLNYFAHTNDANALSCCKRIGDLLVRTYGPGKRNIVDGDWHVGMANSSVLGPMVTLYQFTGDPRYLDFARYIVQAWDSDHGPKIVSTLLATGSVRKVANAKAYEMLSCLVGLLELYRMTGQAEYLAPVEIAWEDIVRNRLYLTGTASWDEYFRDDGWLRADDKNASAGVGEGCVTVTWMQLNLQLLRLSAKSKYADQLERTIFNALTAAQHPEAGSICYFVPLNGYKRYGEVRNGPVGVSCCASSIPRGISLIPSIAYGTVEDKIAVNLYTPGEAIVRSRNMDVRLRVRTDFPVGDQVELECIVPKRRRLTLMLRVPQWSRAFTASVGREIHRGKPGTYLEISREWKPGDIMSLRFDMTPQLITGSPSYPNCVAIQRGPQVMAADQGLNPDVELWLAGLLEPLQIKSADPALLKKWHGTHAYTVAGFDGNELLGQRSRELILVPVADAGQTGQEYRVLLERSSHANQRTG